MKKNFNELISAMTPAVQTRITEKATRLERDLNAKEGEMALCARCGADALWLSHDCKGPDEGLTEGPGRRAAAMAAAAIHRTMIAGGATVVGTEEEQINHIASIIEEYMGCD